MNKQELSFRISSGLKNIIGQELITNQYIAIFELVKNSYDASAKEVNILFRENKIIISDNGTGMSKEDIINKWLFVAYSDKGNNKAEDGRQYVGAKGVGRFACDRLGKRVTIITKKQDEINEHILEVDWSKFEENRETEFQTIHPTYYENPTSNVNSYTSIEISELNNNWSADDIEELDALLCKLIDPFEKKYSIKIVLDFYGQKFIVDNKLLKVLEDLTISMKVSFDETITVELLDRGTIVYRLDEIKNSTLLRDVKMNVMCLNPYAKRKFFEIMKVRNVDYGSVFIYKNSFRVHPIGEPLNDFFNLEGRKNQGYGRYLATRELIGIISIHGNNDTFVEVSSRSGGFIENSYVEDLRLQYMEFVQRPLEKYVYAIKFGYDTIKQEQIYLSELEVDKDAIMPTFIKKYEPKSTFINPIILSNVKVNVKTRIEDILKNDKNINSDIREVLDDTKKQLEHDKKVIEEKEKELLKKEKEKENLLNQNRLLNKLSDKEKVKQAEITHHISKMANNLNYSVDKIFQNLPEDPVKKNEILKQIAIIKNISSKMKVFYNIILNSNIVAENKITINLYEYFDFYINNIYQKSGQDTVIKLSINSNNISPENLDFVVDPYDMSVIIDNMFANAKDSKANFLDISFDLDNNNRIIKIFSDTPHISEENLSKIFELGFSTKGGTGIGLYNIKKIINKYKWQIRVDNVENGVMFTIKLGEQNA